VKISKNVFLVFLIVLIFGIVAGLQIKTIQERDSDNSLAKVQSKKNEIVQLINDEKKISLKLKGQISSLEKENLNLYTTYSEMDKNGVFALLNNKLKNALLFAGMKQVTGSGISVTIDDSSLPPKDRGDSNSSWFIVHNKDVISIINELRKGGAEAISINGERVISTSAIVCAGPTIMINNKKYITPFEIKSIGNSQVLYDTIMNSKIIRDLKDFSLPITIRILDNVTIDAYVLNKESGV